ncbi:MAG: GC-type dockerin domain-anchored protein, partial [Planctomycetota bacterium]
RPVWDAMFRTPTRCPADTNRDGAVTPADFTAWVLGFNTGNAVCDQNDDDACTPADFNAWVINFNAGCP